MKEEFIRCIYCDSKNVHVHKKGFSGKKAVAGAVLTGGIGILAGTLGSNDIKITCLDCGKTFNPGDEKKMDDLIKAVSETSNTEAFIGLASVVAIIAFIIYLIFF